MSNVVELGCKTRLDIDPDKVLKSAIGQCERVLVIGLSKDDSDYFAASTGDKAKLIYDIERFKVKLLSGNFED